MLKTGRKYRRTLAGMMVAAVSLTLAVSSTRAADSPAGLPVHPDLVYAQAQKEAQESLAQIRAAERAAVEAQEAERSQALQATLRGAESRLAAIRDGLADPDRSRRLAALDAGLNASEPMIRALAFEAALAAGADPAAAHLALRTFLSRQGGWLPVTLYATQDDQASTVALNRIGPFVLAVDQFNDQDNLLSGRMGAPGFPVTQPGEARGVLNQTELAVSSAGCALHLRLSAVRTLDGVLRCLNMPVLIARVTLP